MGITLASIRNEPPRDLVVRFVFGAAVSAAAGLIDIAAGARLGGVFLAFPAILPATLTLIEHEGSRRQAEDDDVGAVLGASALIAFAGVVWWLVDRIGAAGALVSAAAVWLVVAVGLYVVFRAVRPPA